MKKPLDPSKFVNGFDYEKYVALINTTNNLAYNFISKKDEMDYVQFDYCHKLITGLRREIFEREQKFRI